MCLFRLKVRCFYCSQTLAQRPANPRSFRCPNCECWNRYDKNGEIMSDEPAMHQESLNRSSFAKRASPHKDRIPTSYNQGVFCRNCQTNQTLQINLLSNYLPAEDDPSYGELLDRLPVYKESLDARYPTVCRDCAGSVEDEIQKAERRARADAIGGWLHKGTQASPPKKMKMEVLDPKPWSFQVLVWRMRGFLWIMTAVVSVLLPASACCSVRARDYLCSKRLPLAPVLAFSSFLWSFWDPTWLRVRTSRFEGSFIRANGRTQWIACQFCAWLARLLASAAHTIKPLPTWWLLSHVVLELSLLYFSLKALHIIKPPSVTLARSASRSRSLTPYPTTIIPTNPTVQTFPLPPSQTDDIFSSLSLSSQPALTRRISAPVFGETTTLRASRQIEAANKALSHSEPMDWTPAKSGMQDENWMRPQRFFAPSEPTGLEDLLSKAQIGDEGERRRQALASGNGRASNNSGVLDEIALYLVALLVVVLLGSALFLCAGSWVIMMPSG